MQQQADPFIVPVCNESIEVLYQDESLLLINKPSGLLSLSGKHPLNKDSVHFRLIDKFPSARLVHRLDFGTSGIMVVGLSKNDTATINRQFQARTVTKTYTAHLFGHLKQSEGYIDHPIAKDRLNFPLQKICAETGKPASTHFCVIKHLTNLLATEVIFTPGSGRTHQLRIHSQVINHPILGCDLYANDEAFKMANRLMLHATSLDFKHPVSGKPMKGFCPCPF